MTSAPIAQQRLLIDLQDLDSRLARLRHERKHLPVLAGVEVLEVDEKALLGNGYACHGVCSFRCVQVGAANPLMILSRPV